MSRAQPRPSAEQRFRSLLDALIGSWICRREARKGRAARACSMHVERVREGCLNV
jgi:hypothetical protein